MEQKFKLGDRVQSRTVGSDSRMVVGEVVEITGNVVRFLLDEGQSKYGRPTFSRPIHKIRKL